MPFFLIAGPTCTVVASHAAVPSLVTVNMPTGQTDGLTDRHQIVILRFRLDAASVISKVKS